MNTLRSMSIFEVSNLELSVRHYGSLGFALIGDWEEYQVANMQRGDVTLMFQQIEGSVPANRGWACYVYVTDIKALHEEFEKIENLDIGKNLMFRDLILLLLAHQFLVEYINFLSSMPASFFHGFCVFFFR